jgi:hypothetical protein
VHIEQIHLYDLEFGSVGVWGTLTRNYCHSLWEHAIWTWIVDLYQSEYVQLEGNPRGPPQSTPSAPMLHTTQTKICSYSPLYNYLLEYTKLAVEYPVLCVRHSEPPLWMSQLGYYHAYDVHQPVNHSRGPNHVPISRRGEYLFTGLQCSSRFDAFSKPL